MIVLWRVTEHCNLACGFCAYDRRLAHPRSSADPARVLRFGRILADHQRLTGNAVLLSWLGGEPMLWPDLFAVSRTLRETCGLSISATTNGTTLQRPQVRDDVLACFSELTVSVDGFSQFHDDVRGWPGGWNRLRASIEALVQARSDRGAALKLRTNVVLMHDNVEQFPSLCRMLSDWGMDEITFNQLGGRDRPAFYPGHRLHPEDVVRLRVRLPLLRAELAERGVRLCGSDRYLDRIDASAADRALAVGSCAPGQDFLFVDEQHRIAPCSFTACAHGVPLDEIESAADLLALPDRYGRRLRRDAETACTDCHSTRVFEKFET